MTSVYLDLLRRAPGYAGQIIHSQPIPPRSAGFGAPEQPLPAALERALRARGINGLYAHQAEALDAVRSGAHLGVVTATASGKTLCYQLPTLEAALEEPDARALFLFPTKALAHDQLRALRTLAEPLGVPVAALDGDTPRPVRDQLRAQARIILSNPDMLHRTVLPDHNRWSRLLARLRFVVIDEAHIYRGVFGTHAALVLRRLRRLCAHYGAAPQFICCSATSANPQQHLSALVGEEVRVIDGDGAPQGARSFVFWNPPVIEGRGATSEERRNAGGRPLQHQPSSLARLAPPEGGRRRSTNIEAANVLAGLMRGGIKTLCFTRSRRGAELVLRYTREALEQNGADLAGRVASYRAGYTPEDRRRIEQAFLEGELLGLVSTNALELGVDIGGVDAVVIAGFPGSIASTWQQAGRAGRSQGQSLAVLVAQDDPLDQFYMRHPDQFFARSHEHARVALENPYILRDQLRCAAFELPLHDADALWFGPTFPALRDWLIRRGALLPLDDGRASSGERWPAAEVNIRSADGASIALKDSENGRTIEQIGATRAPFEIHPGAVYLHQGDSYLVAALHEGYAEARRTQVGYYTQPREETDIRIERVQSQRALGPAMLHLGVVEVTRQVTGYRRKEHYSEALLSEHDLSLPPQTFRTIAVWWTVPEQTCREVEQVCGEVQDALHAMEHAAIGLLPLFAQCDRADIGGLSTALHPGTGEATVFVYDGVPGGVGIAQVGFEQAEAWWEQTRTLLIDCPCAEGCPACVQSPKCGNGNMHLSKRGAAALASLLLGQPIPVSDLSRSSAEATVPMSAEATLSDLRGRLERARSTPAGPRRAALLVALRYRISVERSNLLGEADRAALGAIEQEAARL
ncbi:MAG TPA: DEAD/DEAH box helicase [Roseiflexaceae bacterium]|nr:DEAD/DEAH box helicase [Roseiflexaceae bacterium]